MLRESAYAAERESSVRRRMAEVAREPRRLEDLMRWYRFEWEKEVPTRIHQRGVEPESALGAPVLAGAFRAYLHGSPFATDHDDRLDSTTAGDVRRYPIHAALATMSHAWPISARYLFAVAWTGSNWDDVAIAWHMLPEVGHRFARDALHHLWCIWSRDMEAGPRL
jgi:hypothetical protein